MVRTFYPLLLELQSRLKTTNVNKKQHRDVVHGSFTVLCVPLPLGMSSTIIYLGTITMYMAIAGQTKSVGAIVLFPANIPFRRTGTYLAGKRKQRSDDFILAILEGGYDRRKITHHICRRAVRKNPKLYTRTIDLLSPNPGS